MGLTLLVYYFATGFVVLAALIAYRRWRPSDEPRNVFGHEKPTSLKMRLANVVLVPLAVVFFFIPLWPWILSIEFNFPWHKFKFWTDKAAREVPWTLTDDEPAFAVSKSDLLERFSRAEIEDLERVDDPLHAVPSKPFGHLHKVWQAFTDGLEPEWELWSFQSHWKTPYQDYQMQGYVARQGEKLGPHFLTSQRSREDACGTTAQGAQGVTLRQSLSGDKIMAFSTADALRAYARMMNTLDVKHIEPLLAEDFHYSSQWVFAEITSKQEYLDYIRPKLGAITKSGAKVYAEMAVHDDWGGDPCVVMAQGSPSNLVGTVLAKVDGGQITRLDMCMLPAPAEATRSGEYPA